MKKFTPSDNLVTYVNLNANLKYVARDNEQVLRQKYIVVYTVGVETI